MEEFRQLQVIGRSQDGSILISKKGKATIKTKNHKAVQNESVKIAPHNRVKQYILKEGTAVSGGSGSYDKRWKDCCFPI